MNIEQETEKSAEMFKFIDRVQHKIMSKDSIIQYEEFIAEPFSDRVEYYQFIKNQCNEWV